VAESKTRHVDSDDEAPKQQCSDCQQTNICSHALVGGGG